MLRILLLILLLSPPALALQKADAVARLRKLSEHLALIYQSEAARYEGATTQLFSPRSEFTPSKEVIWNSLDKKRATQIKLELLSYLISRFEARYVDSNDVEIFTREVLRDYMLGLGSPDVSKSSDTDTAIEILIDIGEKLRAEVETDFFERFDIILTKDDVIPAKTEPRANETSVPAETTEPATPQTLIQKTPQQPEPPPTPYTQDPAAEAAPSGPSTTEPSTTL